MKIKLFIMAPILALTLACGNASASHTGMTPVKSPEIPEHITFAGHKINIDRCDMYERFDRELTSMAFTHGTTLLTLKRANRYFPMLIPILKANGVPTDLIYLACIESNLNPRAMSGAGAAGLWQFMPATGKEYGLEVNEYVDERYHPEKSTEAACRYLKSAYSKYGNWESTAASYNAGMGRISRELEAQKAESAYDLHLNDQTSRYIFRLLAMKSIMEHPRYFGYTLDASQLYFPIETENIEVSEPISDWQQWALDHDTNYLTLRELNPWIRAKSLPNKNNKTYTIKIPAKNAMLRSKQAKEVYNHNWISK
ncbi:MAG: lytic transglycosylase domain-containing protein [Paramuribaculum sp.]|nr:lytic transglycosylase domain-containing protein [Paramuribaculum sp.]